jgi:hypothetical protein
MVSRQAARKANRSSTFLCVLGAFAREITLSVRHYPCRPFVLDNSTPALYLLAQEVIVIETMGKAAIGRIQMLQDDSSVDDMMMRIDGISKAFDGLKNGDDGKLCHNGSASGSARQSRIVTRTDKAAGIS